MKCGLGVAFVWEASTLVELTSNKVIRNCVTIFFIYSYSLIFHNKIHIHLHGLDAVKCGLGVTFVWEASALVELTSNKVIRNCVTILLIYSYSLIFNSSIFLDPHKDLINNE